MKTKIIPLIIGGLVLYLLSAGISFAGFKYLNGNTSSQSTDNSIISVNTDSGRSKLDLSSPKTEICPINGQKYTIAEKQVWSGRRPLAVMIENHEDSRPQSGLSKADVVYEAVAEGGITRFVGIYYCGAAAEDVSLAPVRSARVYYINWASEYGKNPIYVHVGGANRDPNSPNDTAKEADAFGLLAQIGWRVPRGNDFDTLYGLGAPVFVRNENRLDHPVATEHTMVSSTDKIYNEALKRGLDNKETNGEDWTKNFVSWKFKDDAPLSERGTTSSIKLGFTGDFDAYQVTWNYDKDNNIYLRENGTQAHLDLNTNKQISAKNVVVLFMKERPSIDANKHYFYANIGTGEAIVFHDGQAIKGTWTKTTREARTKITDAKGKEIQFNSGPIWFEAQPIGKTVEY